ncbi:MAG TPA: hypothetical protein VJ023_14245 [Pyrinomonadaceae bacterium]|nr:hypothetical protein [Pyrinomonadaceae bacterium]
MKQLILGLVIAATFAPSANPQSMPDKEATYALAGPVRTVRMESATLIEKGRQYVEGPRVLNTTVLFNEDGNRTELGIYDEQGSLVRRIVSKFDGKRLTEFLNYDGAGRMWLRGVDDYDEAGRLKKKATYNGDGSLRSQTTLKRNDRGQVIEVTKHEANGTLLDKSIYKFDSRGELQSVDRSIYREDGSLSSKQSHDVREKRTETVSYEKDGTVAGKSVRVNQQITEYAPDGSLRRNTFIFNPGRLPERVTYSSDGNSNKQSPVPDEIDVHGNWTKLTEWVSDAQGTRPIKVHYRTITYY